MCRVKLEDLIKVTAPRLGRYFLRATVTVSGPPEEKRPVLRGYRCMQLHPCFASTIRAAQASCSLEFQMHTCMLQVFMTP